MNLTSSISTAQHCATGSPRRSVLHRYPWLRRLCLYLYWRIEPILVLLLLPLLIIPLVAVFLLAHLRPRKVEPDPELEGVEVTILPDPAPRPKPHAAVRRREQAQIQTIVPALPKPVVSINLREHLRRSQRTYQWN